MDEIKGIPNGGETGIVNQIEALKGIGENIQPVPFAFGEHDDHEIESLLCIGHHGGSHHHCPHDDLMEKLIEAIEDLSSQDIQYVEMLEETSEDLFSRTVSYLCLPLALMDMFRALRNIDSNRKIARAARAYQNYIIAVTKDLESSIDEKLMLKAFQGDSYNLAMDTNHDWLINTLAHELRQVQAASHLDLAQFIGLILNEGNQGQVFRARFIQGFAERLIKNRLTTRIGANKAKSRTSMIQSFSAMQANMRLDPFCSFVAANSANHAGLVNDFIDYLGDLLEPKTDNAVIFT